MPPRNTAIDLRHAYYTSASASALLEGEFLLNFPSLTPAISFRNKFYTYRKMAIRAWERDAAAFRLHYDPLARGDALTHICLRVFATNDPSKTGINPRRLSKLSPEERAQPFSVCIYAEMHPRYMPAVAERCLPLGRESGTLMMIECFDAGTSDPNEALAYQDELREQIEGAALLPPTLPDFRRLDVSRPTPPTPPTSQESTP